jgi:hypothetical protein
MRPYTDLEWDTLPHIIWTHEDAWDPCVLDHSLDDNEQWFDSISEPVEPPFFALFDEFGDYRHRVLVQNVETHDVAEYTPSFFDAYDTPASYGPNESIDQLVYDNNRPLLMVNSGTILPSPCLVTTQPPDYETLRPFFGWLPVDTIKRTFDVTTQYARMPMSSVLKKRYKSSPQ